MITYRAEFLTIQKDNAQRDDDKTVHIVMGNQACDLDSIVSAVTLAYLRSLQMADVKMSWVPLVPIPAKEVRLRTEVSYLFAHVGLDTDTLLCLETFDFDGVCDALFVLNNSGNVGWTRCR